MYIIKTKLQFFLCTAREKKSDNSIGKDQPDCKLEVISMCF